ncbi:unnamed protein product, partial [Polarella glacialis]
MLGLRGLARGARALAAAPGSRAAASFASRDGGLAGRLRGPGAAVALAAACAGAGLCVLRPVAAAEEKATQASPGRFAGAVVIITGAGGDFGRAGALRLKREGATVVLLDAAPQALEASAKALAEVPGPPAMAFLCDVTSDEGVETTVAKVELAHGRITHLWNNAGYQGAVKPIDEYPIADFQRVQDINVVGAFRVLHFVSRSMRKTGGGVVVNTASVAALRGTPAMPAYVASKAALLAMTMSAAKDLAPHGIRVNAISPALIGPGFMWDRQNELHAASGSPYFSRDPEEVGKNKIAGVPLKRVGTKDEVINCVLFLLSEESSYCTGTNLVVDGGLQMRYESIVNQKHLVHRCFALTICVFGGCRAGAVAGAMSRSELRAAVAAGALAGAAAGAGVALLLLRDRGRSSSEVKAKASHVREPRGQEGATYAKILDRLRAARVVPVVSVADASGAASLATALVEGGLPVIEVVFRTAAAEEALRRMAE